MRPGEIECSSRLGDRVRWVPEDIKRDDMSADPVGIVAMMRRSFPRSPDLAIDRILILFDKRIDLGMGAGGIDELWVPPEQIEEEAREPRPTESEEPKDGK